jgi:hypothetical protein
MATILPFKHFNKVRNAPYTEWPILSPKPPTTHASEANRLARRISMHKLKVHQLNGILQNHGNVARHDALIKQRLVNIKPVIQGTKAKMNEAIRKRKEFYKLSKTAPTPKGRLSAKGKQAKHHKDVRKHSRNLRIHERELQQLKKWAQISSKNMAAVEQVKRAHAKEQQHLAKNIMKRRSAIMH